MPATRERILQIVRDVVAPLVRADGGSLYVVNVREDTVALHLAGRYSGCPGNTLALRHFIEPAIQAVAPNVQVVVSSGALVPDGAELVG